MPYKNPEDRKYYESTRPPRKRTKSYYVPKGAIPFVGVDGEGGTSPEGRHEYYLLRVGSEYITGNPLRTKQCFKFLYEQCSKRNIPVAFFFDYDVTMILRDVPRQILDQLYQREPRTVILASGKEEVRPLYWDGWEFDHLPRKEFRCRPKGSRNWAVVSDVSGFYQCSFLAAITTWKIGTPEQIARIAEGKSKRSELSEIITEEEIRYNQEECELLAELVSSLRSTCLSLSLTLPRWQGAGNLASAMLKANNAPRKIPLPKAIRDAAQKAYFGGRFELSMHGMYRETIHEYDIASAYPDAMRKLPCLSCGRWEYGNTTIRALALCHIRWETKNRVYWGPFPFRRKDGSIHYPKAGKGWYWGYEVEAAFTSGLFKVTILESFFFNQECDHDPFSFIIPMYQERKKLGKSDKGMVLKLGLNSLYGKTAQSIGRAVYANPVYAGLITSMTRARMAELCNKYQDSIVMIATDGIYSTQALGIESSNPGLGDWEHETYQGMLFIQPGLYWSGDQVHSKTRTRGVAKSLVEERIPEFISKWERNKWEGKVSFRFTRFYGLRETLHLDAPEKAGQWLEVERTIAYSANDSKRSPIRSNDPVWRSLPLDGDKEQESAPYVKLIGGDFHEHPEYVPNELHAYPYDVVPSEETS